MSKPKSPHGAKKNKAGYPSSILSCAREPTLGARLAFRASAPRALGAMRGRLQRYRTRGERTKERKNTAALSTRAPAEPRPRWMHRVPSNNARFIAFQTATPRDDERASAAGVYVCCMDGVVYVVSCRHCRSHPPNRKAPIGGKRAIELRCISWLHPYESLSSSSSLADLVVRDYTLENAQEHFKRSLTQRAVSVFLARVNFPSVLVRCEVVMKDV